MIKIGMKLKDNDPRNDHVRILEITHVFSDAVEAIGPSGRRSTISKKRIFSDGKPRKSGFDLIMDGKNENP